ncbi:membrane-associated proteins in eicosanoid and glutathione metabolism [Hypoxylon fragiforme]|uniref:membrane-associated proteins in eicosanoid and glutathione metabolism n=1 Tax=Hypoxylon fragiforme TaxID=63214 RepID=UPI0020C69975|nr:membrane-associated proteins in eicosanoid and glutathione metabolism [Hypoxylon fragiforme]KAI2608475.1 membrane-associated proteins in eicosanoid and glutathione metabolism [Hypoxylon fragiforme]
MAYLQIPREYGYVLTVAASSFFINTFHQALTGRARKASGITYPTAYASQELADKDPKAHAFNCAQRAHANYTENLTPFLGALLISGLYFPTSSTTLGAAWVIGRVLYAYGYTSSGPKGRVTGSVVSIVTDAALKIMAIISGVKIVLSA